MLMGEHHCAMDEKGRLSFPSRLRDEMGDSFIIAKWLDNCIGAFSREEWDRVAAQLLDKSESKTKLIKRYLYASACEVKPDKQGRILMPASLREYAGLDKDVVVIGVGSRAEIWEAEAWRLMNEQMVNAVIEQNMEALDF